MVWVACQVLALFSHRKWGQLKLTKLSQLDSLARPQNFCPFEMFCVCPVMPTFRCHGFTAILTHFLGQVQLALNLSACGILPYVLPWVTVASWSSLCITVKRRSCLACYASISNEAWRRKQRKKQSKQGSLRAGEKTSVKWSQQESATLSMLLQCWESEELCHRGHIPTSNPNLKTLFRYLSMQG